MKGLINNNQIAYIEINEEKEAKNIKYFNEERGFFNRLLKKEGFYILSKNGLTREWIFLEKIPSYILLNEKKALIKPHIIIELSNGRTETIYFDTSKEMNSFIKREFQERFWRKVI